MHYDAKVYKIEEEYEFFVLCFIIWNKKLCGR